MKILDSQRILKYYQALVNRDPSYVGVFFVAVKTTSIFCISTCRARKPKLENVEFYTNTQDVVAQGYRPCKICKPTGLPNSLPPLIKEALVLFQDQPDKKLSDAELKKQGISPVLVRRWFKQNYGITFQMYQRMQRMNHAFQEVKQGKKTTDTAFDSGYESLSGFAYAFKKLIGKSPVQSKAVNILLQQQILTPLGPMIVVASDKGICLLEFSDRKILAQELIDICKHLQAKIIVGENDHTKAAEEQLSEYFSGKRRAFNLSLDMPGTDFQKLVWNGLEQIPFGQTINYQQLAMQMHKPNGSRAVARANASNRIAIVVPCHRVIGKNGKLTGYGGGLERKAWLLRHEQNH